MNDFFISKGIFSNKYNHLDSFGISNSNKSRNLTFATNQSYSKTNNFYKSTSNLYNSYRGEEPFVVTTNPIPKITYKEKLKKICNTTLIQPTKNDNLTIDSSEKNIISPYFIKHLSTMNSSPLLFRPKITHTLTKFFIIPKNADSISLRKMTSMPKQSINLPELTMALSLLVDNFTDPGIITILKSFPGFKEFKLALKIKNLDKKKDWNLAIKKLQDDEISSPYFKKIKIFEEYVLDFISQKQKEKNEKLAGSIKDGIKSLKKIALKRLEDLKNKNNNSAFLKEKELYVGTLNLLKERKSIFATNILELMEQKEKTLGKFDEISKVKRITEKSLQCFY